MRYKTKRKMSERKHKQASKRREQKLMKKSIKKKHLGDEVLYRSSSRENLFNPMESSTPILIKNNTLTPRTLVKQRKHVWTPSGYESPALALRKASKMDRIKDQVQGWRMKASKGEKLLMKIEDVDRIFNI